MSLKLFGKAQVFCCVFSATMVKQVKERQIVFHRRLREAGTAPFLPESGQ